MRSHRGAQRSDLEVTILGCGTSTGVPLLFCTCKVCRSKNPRNHRTRASIWVRVGGKSFLIDTATDLRQQALRAKIPRVDAILYTHPHSDHVSGVDEIRGFNYIQKQRIPAYGNAWTVHDLRNRYPYIFASDGKSEGGGVALIDLLEFSTNTPSLDIQGVSVQPLSLRHGSQECVGYRIGPMAYATDCSLIPEETMTRMEGLDLLILDCLRLDPHGTHFNLVQALEVIERLKPRRTVLTHLGHDFEYAEWTKRGPRSKLPRGVTLAYDGMKVRAKL